MKATTAETILQGIATAAAKVDAGEPAQQLFEVIASDADTRHAVTHIVGAAMSTGAHSPQVEQAIAETVARLRVIRDHDGPGLVTEA
jgi:hypothetical protein